MKKRPISMLCLGLKMKEKKLLGWRKKKNQRELHPKASAAVVYTLPNFC